jgi:hypothetical protein
VLSLRSCYFQYGVAGLGRPARLYHDGSVTTAHRAWEAGAGGLPPGRDLELLAESGGGVKGRFLMPRSKARVSRLSSGFWPAHWPASTGKPRLLTHSISSMAGGGSSGGTKHPKP